MLADLCVYNAIGEGKCARTAFYRLAVIFEDTPYSPKKGINGREMGDKIINLHS